MVQVYVHICDIIDKRTNSPSAIQYLHAITFLLFFFITETVMLFLDEHTSPTSMWNERQYMADNVQPSLDAG
jgi:hypothetical protein